MGEVGRHGVDRSHTTHRNHVFVCSRVPHHTDALHREIDTEGLPNFVVQAGRTNFFEHDRVRGTKRRKLFARDVTHDANAEPRAGERMSPDQRFGKPECAPYFSHFVLEQFAQGLHELQPHVIRQPAHIVVGLYCDRRTLHRHALDDVRVQGALYEVIAFTELLRFFFEHVDEQAANNAALLLRFAHPFEGRKESVRSINAHQLDTERSCKKFFDFFALIQSHHAVINEDAGQLFSDRAVNKRCSDRRIDTAAQATDHEPFANLAADLRKAAIDEGIHRPRALATANVSDEIAQQLFADFGVNHFGMKLDGPDGLSVVTNRGIRRVLARSQNFVARRKFENLVAVTHPHDVLGIFREPCKQAIFHVREF